jgi:hypothetical protein
MCQHPSETGQPRSQPRFTLLVVCRPAALRKTETGLGTDLDARLDDSIIKGYGPLALDLRQSLIHS